MAKAGLLALMRQYAVDLGPHGIRSNAVNADRVRTDLFGGGVLEARAQARGVSPDMYFRQNLLGRETTVTDVAEAFGYPKEAMLIDVEVGVQKPELVDTAKLLGIFPYGRPSIRVVFGGLDVEKPHRAGVNVIANAAVMVSFDMEPAHG